MQKKLLSILVGSACCVVATNAVAELDFTSTTPGPDTYLTSVVGDNGASNTTGDIDSGINCDAKIKYPFGFSISAGTSKYVRLDLVGATFASAFKTSAAAVVVSSSATATASIASGGAEGSTFVILSITSSVNTVLPTDTITIDLANTTAAGDQTGLDITSTSAVEVEMATYEFAADAIAQTPKLSSASGEVIDFMDGLGATTITDAASKQISPTDPTMFSGATIFTELSETKTSLNDTCGANGVATLPTDLFTNADLVVTGDFTAFPTNTSDVFIQTPGTALTTCDGTTGTIVDASAVDPATNTATFTNTVTSSLLTTSGYDLCVEDNGDLAMVDGAYTCTVTLNGAALDGEEIATDAACGNLQFAGSSDRVNYGMTPGGIFKQYFRISNPSTTSGVVTVTLINDAGDPASFDLAYLTGQAELASGASTAPLSLSALFAAAKAAKPGFEKANTGKMRVIVRGNFGTDLDTSGPVTKIFGDANSTDGIIIEAATVNLDGDGFSITE